MSHNRPHVLFVDDHEALRKRMAQTLSIAGYRVSLAGDLSASKRIIQDGSLQAILLDLDLGGENGIDLLEWLKTADVQVPVIMYSGVGTIAAAVRAVKLGAYDFVEKSADIERLLLTVRNAVERSQLSAELSRSARRQSGLIGDSPAMVRFWKDLERVAAREVRVLITGETGTGKDLVARALHRLSPRRDQPFVRVTCTVITESLGASELFGYKKGSHSGAKHDEPGRFKAAHGGTIFLDEIGDLPLSLQAKLLTVLQTGEIEPVGARVPEKIDVRVITATNKNLLEQTRRGAFRDDLYFRLNEIELKLPPLRERREDLRPLLESFLLDQSQRHNSFTLTLDEGAIDALLSYPWPGNVRELERLAGRLSIYVEGSVVTREDIQRHLGLESIAGGSQPTGYESAKEDFEREYFRTLLTACDHNVAAVARGAGLHYTTVHAKLKALGLIGNSL